MDIIYSIWNIGYFDFDFSFLLIITFTNEIVFSRRWFICLFVF